MAEDLRAHMHAIQENEHNQLQELTSFLALETNFVQSYLDVLHDVKEDWQGGYDRFHGLMLCTQGWVCHFRPKIKRNRSKAISQSQHTLHPSRSNSQRSNGHGAIASSLSSDLSDGEQSTLSKHSRRGSSASKPPSRPTSRLARMRANSSTASAPSGDDEKHGNEKSRRMSVAEWASSAVDSVTGSKGKKNKDKEAFANLDDVAAINDAAEYQTSGSMVKKSSLARRSSSRNKSKENLPVTTPKVPPRILMPPSVQTQKVVRALYDFSGSTDELSFKTGNQIVVLNEVLDDWWMGELDGQKGLFPMSYTEAAGSNPHMAGAQSKRDGTANQPGVSNSVNGHEDYLTSDVEEDHELAATPMVIRSPFYGTFNDTMSVTSSVADEEEDFKMQPMFIPQEEQPFLDVDHRFVIPPTPPPQRQKRSILLSRDPAQQPLINGALDEDPSSQGSTTMPSKKPPPPPPPPRRPMNQISSSGPPIPERKSPVSNSKTSSASSLNVSPPSSIDSHNYGYDRSPFESAVEFEGTIGCRQFRQNPFKARGMCSNCLEFHD